MVMVWLWFNTELVSEREVTTDRCHPLVGPYTSPVQGMSGRESDDRRSRVVFLSTSNCVELNVYVYLCSCLGGMRMLMGALQKTRANDHKLSMFLYENAFLPSACLYVCNVHHHKR